MKSGVYKILCEANGKFYIGSSFNIDFRMRTHFRHLKNGNHINPHLQNSYNKYGESSFSVETLEECPVDQLLEKEQYWLDETQSFERHIGFNNTQKADRPSGYKHTETAKKKMSLSKIGITQKKEHVEKRSKSLQGRVLTQEQKEKMSISKLGAKNPMFGKKEDPEKTKVRMKNCLDKPRWNKGLTKKDDPRLEKLGDYARGKEPCNALSCVLLNQDNQEKWEGSSLKNLSTKTPISLSTLNRIRSKTAGKKISKKYKLIINNEK